MIDTSIQLIDEKNFDKIINDKQIKLYTLTNKNGMTCQITNYGARVVSLWVVDRYGNYDDIVLGYDRIDDYLKSNELYFGAIVGRCANRIANGEFSIQGKTYKLAKNINDDHLHGGNTGFNNVVWQVQRNSVAQLELSYLSIDGEEGYPGNLHTKVTYALTDDHELKICYQATTDKATPVNLTHHSFFNLQGAGKDIDEHILKINSSNYTPINARLLPTGKIVTIAGTPFDFRKPTTIGKHINDNHTQIKLGLGYDHNFILDGTGMRNAAKINDPKSGRTMEVITNQPGMQFYSSNFLDGKDIGKKNIPYKYRTGFCLETQHFPNSPNQSNFPSIILNVGETYQYTCIYKFNID